MPRIEHLFLDRDGVVIEDRHYLADPGGVVLLPGVPQALAGARDAGVRLYLVSNQSGIGRGYFTREACLACQRRLDELLAEQGIHFTDADFCPHAPEEGCACRKPGTGMWLSMAKRHGLRPEICAMVGDKASDIAFARNCGFAAAVLVLSGKGAEQARQLGLPPLPEGRECLPLAAKPGFRPQWPDVLAWDLGAACRWLLDSEVGGQGA